jgi:transcription initiation factor TFIIB
MDPSISSTMQRLRSWDFRVQSNTSSDRNLKIALKLLNTLKDKLGLSDTIVEKVDYTYRKAQERGFVRGRIYLQYLPLLYILHIGTWEFQIQ